MMVDGSGFAILVIAAGANGEHGFQGLREGMEQVCTVVSLILSMPPARQDSCYAPASRAFVYLCRAQDDALNAGLVLYLFLFLGMHISENIVSRDLNATVCAIVSHIMILIIFLNGYNDSY